MVSISIVGLFVWAHIFGVSNSMHSRLMRGELGGIGEQVYSIAGIVIATILHS